MKKNNMNIKILDSWLREYLKTKATPKKIGELLSLTSVGVEHIGKYKNDFVYDIEVTTNRPELMSVIGLAREAATVLSQSGVEATFVKSQLQLPQVHITKNPELTIKFDPKLVNRICAVIIEVTIKDSPQQVKDRLEASGIRSLNNVIDITNYVMREIGHPTHVFDYDRLLHHTLTIRTSKKGEKMKTLDNKDYTLSGGDIVADDGKGEIVDLISIMGTANSVVTNSTKRILFFIDNVDPHRLRKTSMELGIRTEAVVLNEKGLNPELATNALARGIQLFEKLANGKIVSQITDIYPNPPKEKTIMLRKDKMDAVIGVAISLSRAKQILTDLGFHAQEETDKLLVTVPTQMSGPDMQIPEDLIEEIARVYGYHNIPDALPTFTSTDYVHLEQNEFYWEDRVKDTLKYWGFIETYTYPMVSETLYEGPIENAVTIANQLSDDMVYMRETLIPSLLQVVKENQDHEVIKLFELANIYEKDGKHLPKQTMKLAGLIHKPKASFLEVKGIIEQLLKDLEIENISFKQLADRYGAMLFINQRHSGEEGRRLQNPDSGQARMTKKNTPEYLGTIEILDEKTVTFELYFAMILQHATLKKIYKPVSKYPPVVEDLAVIASENVQTGDLMEAIKKQSSLITEVSLLDKYQDTRTFHIIYQSYEKNLTDKEVGEIREKILKYLREKFNAQLKG
ncbi:MAG: phenylalanine--tRNA ligase subunit beta [Candidatus Levyibacteriota bacterium]